METEKEVLNAWIHLNMFLEFLPLYHYQKFVDLVKLCKYYAQMHFFDFSLAYFHLVFQKKSQHFLNYSPLLKFLPLLYL